MYNIYFWAILLILVSNHALGLVLDFLNGKMWSDKVPDRLSGIIDDEKYARSQRYYRDNRRLGNFSSTLNLVVILLMIILAGFSWLDEICRSVFAGETLITLLFFGIIGLASNIGNLPFNWYSTFIIEEKYGFNKTKPWLFLTDNIKSLLLSFIIGGALLALLSWIFINTGNIFWLLAWTAITLFSVFMNFFYSELIVPLFNKQKPLEEGELRDEIQTMADKAGFKLDNIYTIDGSKRSTKANAYFSGLGSKKRIVLYDTLGNDLTNKQIVAVLSHEIGHYKKKHNIAGLAWGILQTGLMLYIFSLFSGNTDLAMALGSPNTSFHITLLGFVLIYSPVSLLLGIISNLISRRHEFEADKFAAGVNYGKELASALKTLSVKNLSNLNPHPLFVFFYYSHPPLLERIEALEEYTH